MSKLILNPDGSPLIINGQECYLVDRLTDLFRTGIPELDADLDRWDQALSMPAEEGQKYVYVIGFTDGTTKVGISKNPERRISTIEKQSGRTIREYRISDSFPAKTSFEIECLMKQALAAYSMEGEFFNVPFKKVIGLLDYYVKEYA